jgi:hypothetical protein
MFVDQTEQLERQREVEQENIYLDNQSTISPTTDQEMRDAHNSSNDNSSSDE